MADIRQRIMRTKYIIFASCAAIIGLSGCSYDDTELRGQIEKLDSRVTVLEQTVDQLKTNLIGLQTTIDAALAKTEISNVSTLAEGAGYTITFSDSKFGTITLYNGSNPSLSAKKDSDGKYYWYWTVSGDWLIDETGNKIPTSLVPQFRVNAEGYLEVSYDGLTYSVVDFVDANGTLFTPEVFKSIENGDDAVTFTLGNGDTIVIPKAQVFSLNINASTIGIMANQTLRYPYTITNADEGTFVAGFSNGDFAVSIISNSNSDGFVEITAPPIVGDGKVLVIATNEKGATSARVLSFESGILIIQAPSETVGIEGGTVIVSVTTNVDYIVDIPSGDKWVTLAETKATHMDELTFSVSANSGALRSTTISIKDNYGVTMQTFTISQLGSSVGGGSADLETFNNGNSTFSFGSGKTTANGWTADNVKIIKASVWDAINIVAPQLRGDTDKTGVLYSPLLTEGCGKLTVKYGSNGNIPNGLSFKVEILNAENAVVQSKTETKTDAEKLTEYTAEWDINYAGDYKIVLTNLCPSQETGTTNDWLVITNITWTGYSE